MAQLILTRRKQFLAMSPPYQIVVDDRLEAPILVRQTIGIELPPGHHEVAAKMGTLTSDPIQIDAVLEGSHHFEVGTRVAGWYTVIHLLPAVLMIVMLPFLRSNMLVVINFGVLPAVILSFVSTFHSMYVTMRGSRLLYFKRLSGSDTPAQGGVICDVEFQYADLQPFQPLKPVRVQFSVRGIMIAVAIVAVVLWLGMGHFRSLKQAQHQRTAQMHSEIEAIWRENEQRQNQLIEVMKRANGDSRFFRGSAARSAATADYHQAMRRKYERAAALGLLSVEPDPPEPPRP